MVNKRLNVLIISPAFPNAINGLGDYSVTLANALNSTIDVEIIFAGLTQIEEVAVSPYATISHSEGLKKIIAKYAIQSIILNYSNYGYQKKGIPFWLLQQMKIVNQKELKILTFFHELNATSYKPWQSVFWLKPIQQYIYKSLYEISSTCYCSNDRVYRILEQSTNDQGLKLKKLGIFSNIPEPNNLVTFEKRAAHKVVVFGSYGRRKEIYERGSALKQFIKDYSITEIIDIGAGDFTAATKELNINFEKKGILDKSEIASILMYTRWGLIDYPESLIGKSGIFAAYAAFGLAVYNLNNHKEKALEDLTAGKDYLSNNHYCSNFNAEKASENIFSWYVTRNLKHHTQQIAADLT